MSEVSGKSLCYFPNFQAFFSHWLRILNVTNFFPSELSNLIIYKFYLLTTTFILTDYQVEQMKSKSENLEKKLNKLLVVLGTPSRYDIQLDKNIIQVPTLSRKS